MSNNLNILFKSFSLDLPLGWVMHRVEFYMIQTVELLQLSFAKWLFAFWISRQICLVNVSYIYVLDLVGSYSWLKLRNSRLFVDCWLCFLAYCFVSKFSPQGSMPKYCSSWVNVIDMLHWACSLWTSRSLVSRSLSFNLLVVFFTATTACAWNLQFLHLVVFNPLWFVIV